MKTLISMEKPRLSSKIEEVEYHGVKFKVKREFYVFNELGEYTTTEQDQKWWDDMKRQYYEYLGKVISDAKYLDILEFIDPLIIIKDKKDKTYPFKAFNSDKIENEFYTSHDTFLLSTENLIGEGRTPMEAVKDLFWKIQ